MTPEQLAEIQRLRDRKVAPKQIARQLGFEPHKDYAAAKEILGERPDALPELTFGRDGQPFYFDGPYDNPQKVIKTLEQSVGVGNFHYMLNAGMSSGADDFFVD